MIEAFHGLDQNILIQKFIQEAKGADIRALVVGRRVVAAMRRQAVAGEFRSNIHRGGKAKKVRLPPEYRKTALAAARVLGLRVAGVDMIESAEGPMVMEVNSSPGLEGIQKATGVDVAAAIIEPWNTKSRPVGRGEKSRRIRTRVPTSAAAASTQRSVQGRPRRQSEPILQDRGVQPSKIQSRLQIAAADPASSALCRSGPAVPAPGSRNHHHDRTLQAILRDPPTKLAEGQQHHAVGQACGGQILEESPQGAGQLEEKVGVCGELCRMRIVAGLSCVKDARAYPGL